MGVGSTHVESAGRREFYRLDLEIPVHYREILKQGECSYQLGPRREGQGVNFSGGGLAFLTDRLLEVGAFLYLEIVHPEMRETVRALVKVIRMMVREYNGEEVMAAVGSFVLIREEHRDALVGFMHRHTRKSPQESVTPWFPRNR